MNEVSMFCWLLTILSSCCMFWICAKQRSMITRLHKELNEKRIEPAATLQPVLSKAERMADVYKKIAEDNAKREREKRMHEFLEKEPHKAWLEAEMLNPKCIIEVTFEDGEIVRGKPIDPMIIPHNLNAGTSYTQACARADQIAHGPGAFSIQNRFFPDYRKIKQVQIVETK